MKLYNPKKLQWLYGPRNRVLFFLFILVPIPVVLFSISLYHRLPEYERATLELKSSFWLRDEVEREKRAGTEEKIEIAKTHWEDVKRDFPDSYEGVSDWIMDLSRFISARGFRMSFKMDELRQAGQGVEGISLLPIKVTLMVKRVKGQTGSELAEIIQFVELLREIVKYYHEVDLAGAMMTSSGDDTKTMNVDFNLWVGFTG